MKNKKRIAAIILSMTLASGIITYNAAPIIVNATTTNGSTDTVSSATTKTGSTGSNQSTPPTRPSDNNGGTPPEKPSGDNGGTPPDMQSDSNNSNNNSNSSSSSSSGSGQSTGGKKSAPTGNPPSGQKPSGNPPSGNAQSGGGANTQSYDYTGTLTGALTADGKEVSSDGETTKASEKDQNVALAENSGTLKITKGTLTKSGSDEDGDNCNFYGINSILLSVGNNSKAYISESTLSADSTGSNGLFATNAGTVYANVDSINTTADNSRGVDATYKGNVIGNKLTISTQGDHSAALATDRGGGNVSVTNSTLKTAGSGSPLIYSTGDIEVDGVSGTATGSQIAGMEGLNRILIYNSDLTSDNKTTTGSDPVANAVILYQSTSGDADTATDSSGVFQAVNSNLKSAITSGSFFYVTNTSSNIYLENTDLNYDSSKANLIQIEGNDSNNWGTAGSNGGTVKFTAKNETLSGNVSVDTISSLNMYLLNKTTYTGAMTIKENSAGSATADKAITVNISSDSKWVVTKNTTINNLNAESGAKIVDKNGKTVTIVANGKTVVKGDSDITLTVTGTYSDKVTTDDSNKAVTDYIDRTDFDSYYKTSTTFGTNGQGTNTSSNSTGKSTTGTTDTADKSTTVPYKAIGGLASLAAIAGAVGYIIYRRKKS